MSQNPMSLAALVKAKLSAHHMDAFRTSERMDEYCEAMARRLASPEAIAAWEPPEVQQPVFVGIGIDISRKEPSRS